AGTSSLAISRTLPHPILPCTTLFRSITHGVIDIGIEDPVRFVKQYGMGKPVLRLGDIRDRIQSMLLGELAQLISNSGAQSIMDRSEEHTSELQSRGNLVCRLLLDNQQ